MTFNFYISQTKKNFKDTVNLFKRKKIGINLFDISILVHRLLEFPSNLVLAETIVCSFSILTQFSSDTVSKVSEGLKEDRLGSLGNVPADQFVKFYIYTRNTA